VVCARFVTLSKCGPDEGGAAAPSVGRGPGWPSGENVSAWIASGAPGTARTVRGRFDSLGIP